MARANGFSRYDIRRDGTVYSKITRKVLKPKIGHNGYKSLTLIDDCGARKDVLVHRLVAECFITNPRHLPVVNHKDENKLNNSADNLEWCSVQYNATYGKCATQRNQRVKQLKPDGSTEVYESLKEAQESTGIKYQNISEACRCGRTAGGYKWEYIGKPRKWSIS